MNFSKNVIQFRNGFVNLPVIKKAQINVTYPMAMSIASEVMQFGFILDKDAIENLQNSSKEELIKFHNQVIEYLKEATGSKRNYQAFWKGFPEQVMEMSECELWFHQMVHYISYGAYDPSEWTKTKPTAFEQPKYTFITSGDEAKFSAIFTNLVSINQSLTPDDLAIVEFFVKNKHELKFPEHIPFKETLCTTLASMIESGHYEFI